MELKAKRCQQLTQKNNYKVIFNYCKNQMVIYLDINKLLNIKIISTNNWNLFKRIQ